MTHGPEFRFLRALPLFSAMADNVLADMARGLGKRKMHAGEYIFFQDDVVEHLFIVELGEVEIHKSDIHGRQVSLWRIETGNAFCLANLLANLLEKLLSLRRDLDMEARRILDLQGAALTEGRAREMVARLSAAGRRVSLEVVHVPATGEPFAWRLGNP